MQNDSEGQVHKPVFIPPIKEIIPAIFGPKLQRAFKHFKQLPRIFLCVARPIHYILLGFPFNSILSYPLEYKANSSFTSTKQLYLRFPISKVLTQCSSSLVPRKPMNVQYHCTQGTVGESMPEGNSQGTIPNP